MSRFRGRGQQVPADVAARADLDGEKVLASAETTDGTWLFGTRDALVVVDPVETRRIVWEQVQHADWDRETDTLRVVEVAPYGERSPVHTLGLEEPGRLLQLVRERITASVVLSRRVPVTGRKGLTVIGRRPPRGTGEITGEITWGFDLDPGLDPDDPAVLEAGAAGLRDARRDLGLE